MIRATSWRRNSRLDLSLIAGHEMPLVHVTLVVSQSDNSDWLVPHLSTMNSCLKWRGLTLFGKNNVPSWNNMAWIAHKQRSSESEDRLEWARMLMQPKKLHRSSMLPLALMSHDCVTVARAKTFSSSIVWGAWQCSNNPYRNHRQACAKNKQAHPLPTSCTITSTK